jgi:hypothetical protein
MAFLAYQKEDTMLEKYFSAPKTLAHLRSDLSGPYIDGFAEALARDSYSSLTAVRYLRGAAHFGHFLQRRSGSIHRIDSSTLDAFSRHLPRCHCSLARKRGDNYHAQFGAKRFHSYLVQTGICQPPRGPGADSPEPELIVSFREWFREHRGVAEPTLRLYTQGAAALIEGLGVHAQAIPPLRSGKYSKAHHRPAGFLALSSFSGLVLS